jgi:heme/copper-type cytochrome/quinol oxidase subunit 4
MTFAQFVTSLIGLANTVVVPLIFSFAFAAFIWGVFNYFFFHSGEEEKRIEARKFVFWGIVGMVVLFSVWGFVNLVLSTLNLPSNT